MSEQVPGDRRPIAAREWSMSKRMAGRLAALGVSPNAISVAGMICGVSAGLVLAWTSALPEIWQRVAWVAGAVLVVLRLTANMLDGMVAVESGRVSPVGELYNEVPDRVSDVATLVGFGFAANSDPVLGCLAACLAVFIAYVRALGKAVGAGQDFRGPMAKQQRMATVIAVALWAGFLPASLQPTVGGLALPALALIVILIGGTWTALRRLGGIARFLRNA